jgi:hypothetical protein
MYGIILFCVFGTDPNVSQLVKNLNDDSFFMRQQATDKKTI